MNKQTSNQGDQNRERKHKAPILGMGEEAVPQTLQILK